MPSIFDTVSTLRPSKVFGGDSIISGRFPILFGLPNSELGWEWASSLPLVAFLPLFLKAELLSLGAGSSSISGIREEFFTCWGGLKEAPILTSALEGTWEMEGDLELSTMSSGSTSTTTLLSYLIESLWMARGGGRSNIGSVLWISINEGRLGVNDSVRLDY